MGDMVIPLEQEISKAAAKHFPRFNRDYGSLAEKLNGLGLAGSDRIRTLNQDIADVLFTDASDAPQRLGAETSAIYDNLKWALEVKRAYSTTKCDGSFGIFRPIAVTSRPCRTPAFQGSCAANLQTWEPCRSAWARRTSTSTRLISIHSSPI